MLLSVVPNVIELWCFLKWASIYFAFLNYSVKTQHTEWAKGKEKGINGENKPQVLNNKRQ